jgi:hypothetical protein
MLTNRLIGIKLDVPITDVFCWVLIVELCISKYIKIRYLKCLIDYQT